jgi:hypothetical protein
MKAKEDPWRAVTVTRRVAATAASYTPLRGPTLRGEPPVSLRDREKGPRSYLEVRLAVEALQFFDGDRVPLVVNHFRAQEAVGVSGSCADGVGS